jgi:hypothetical protein
VKSDESAGAVVGNGAVVFAVGGVVDFGSAMACEGLGVDGEGTGVVFDTVSGGGGTGIAFD